MAKMTPVNMSVAAVHAAVGLSSDAEMPVRAVPDGQQRQDAQDQLQGLSSEPELVQALIN